ncbi:MAG: polyprenyl synthetase family protein [Deltaproteobacteria bacterium]|nr:polyprenyl synthetase family protein [Deltaproteobacteria bacterium]
MAKNLLSEIAMIPKVSRYLIASGGKRFRPMLVVLGAKLCGYQGPRTVPLASAIEFIHTATLLHDDVVDSAFMRRGIASANTVWGNGASVLVGDFLYCKSFSIIVQDGNLRVLEVISTTTTLMAEGEVMQWMKKGNPETHEGDYFFVVTHKTARLISAACRIGAILGGVAPEQEKALADFGLQLGIAFQLVDDALDYSADEEVFGKAIGKDLEEGKITLPLIYALKTAPPDGQKRIAAVIRDPERSPEDLAFVMKAVQGCGAVPYTTQRAAEFVSKARAALSSFPPTPEKEALLILADYTIQRKK